MSAKTKQHTPGPWPQFLRISDSDSRLVCNPHYNCEIIVQCMDPDEEQSTADLIRAAPAMLAALEASRREYGRLHDFLSDAIEGGRLKREDIPDDYDAFVNQLETCIPIDEQARAAIAKAKGE